MFRDQYALRTEAPEEWCKDDLKLIQSAFTDPKSDNERWVSEFNPLIIEPEDRFYTVAVAIHLARDRRLFARASCFHDEYAKSFFHAPSRDEIRNKCRHLRNRALFLNAKNVLTYEKSDQRGIDGVDDRRCLFFTAYQKSRFMRACGAMRDGKVRKFEGVPFTDPIEQFR
jgi:hypothetical protein